MIIWGLTRVLSGDLLGGLWTAFIGWFLNGAAESTRQEQTVQQSVSSVTASSLMEKPVTAIPPTMTIGGDGPFPRKPNPAGLQHLLTSAGVDGQSAVLVGDSVIDWRTARHAATSICVARYGFGFEGFPVEELGPGDRTVDAPEELLRLS